MDTTDFRKRALEQVMAGMEEMILAAMAAGVPISQIRIDQPKLEVRDMQAKITGAVYFAP